MKYPRCQHENPTPAKFCEECATPMARTCAGCGSPLSPTAKYRRRDDFEHHDGEVRSRRGVVRTHTMRDAPIFARPLAPADLEERLRTLYDPYYSALEHLLGELRQAYGYAMLLDGHTGSPRRMKDHQVIIGTRQDATCAPQLATTVAARGKLRHPLRGQGPLRRRQGRGDHHPGLGHGAGDADAGREALRPACAESPLCLAAMAGPSYNSPHVASCEAAPDLRVQVPPE